MQDPETLQTVGIIIIWRIYASDRIPDCWTLRKCSLISDVSGGGGRRLNHEAATQVSLRVVWFRSVQSESREGMEHGMNFLVPQPADMWHWWMAGIRRLISIMDNYARCHSLSSEHVGLWLAHTSSEPLLSSLMDPLPLSSASFVLSDSKVNHSFLWLLFFFCSHFPLPPPPPFLFPSPSPITAVLQPAPADNLSICLCVPASHFLLLRLIQQ